MTMVLWLIVVTAAGTTVEAYAWQDTFQACERRAIKATIEGQQARANLGLSNNGYRAYCTFATERPRAGEAAPRPGVQI